MVNQVSREISILSADLASQIAAGEVVERPASVAKELIENALDAGANRIEVELEAGGMGRLRILDNGHGIAGGQLERAILRHATSKLFAFTELEGLLTYGFRGEALPSIASVSRLEIKTRSRGEKEGSLLLAEGTNQARRKPTAHPVGTSVEMRELFFNVPARRKFLRSENTEAGHVLEVVSDAALCRFDVGFFYSREGRKARQFPAAKNRKERVLQWLNEEQLLSIQSKRGPLLLEAYLAPPALSRKGAGGLKWIVNGRPVKDRVLSGTLARAYGELLESGRYPRGVVYLDLPGTLVDINVHPQKTEVRFSNPSAVSEALYSMVQAEVQKRFARTTKSYPLAAQTLAKPGAPQASAGPEAPSGRLSDSQLLSPAAARPAARSTGRSPGKLPSRQSPAGLGKAAGLAQPPGGKPGAPQLGEDATGTPQRTYLNLRFRYQLKGRFLVCENEDEVLLLDQHVASEAVHFQQLWQGYQAGGLSAQRLLFPQSITLDQAALGNLDISLLARLGIDLRIRQDSQESALSTLHSLPELLRHLPIADVVSAVLAWQKLGKEVDVLFRTLACKAALSYDVPVNQELATALLRGLSLVEAGAPLLHRKLIVHRISLRDLLGREDV